MTTAGPTRFFLVIGVQPAYTALALAALVAIAIFTVVLDPGQLDGALAMLLFAQMFLASTGFVTRARRGHFDPVLVDRRTRSRVIAAHAVVSILPGLVAWALVGSVAWLAGNPAGRDALLGTRAIAMFIVGAISWSLGFFLPRGTAGILWSAAILLAVVRGLDLRSLAVGSRGVTGAAFSVLICPFMALGIRPIGALATALAALVALGAVLAAWHVAERMDCSLVDYSS